ncbi:MAG: 3'(2'),5'-bisphosphate nucleotidase CysQ [Bacteroidota bacterium]
MNDLILVRQVVDIARQAGVAILDIYENYDDVGIEQKSDNSPLTLADRNANEVICKGLEALEVRYPIVSEENKAIAYEERKNYAYYWLVDPLDGTKEFIKRNGEFTVNIALIHHQQVHMGVVYAPCLDEMYWAVKGRGAFCIKSGKEESLQAKRFSMSDEHLNIVCSRSHLNEATQKFVAQLSQPELVAKGSSLKFLSIANGEAHIYPRLAPTMEWDTGAAQIILEEAGGSVINFESKQDLIYNKENLLNPHFVAYGQLIS